MKKIFLVLIAVSQLVLFFDLVAIAADSEKPQLGTDKTNEKKQADRTLFINYKPPKTGKPGGRVGGGTRTVGNTHLMLTALVPDHMGLTSKSQPSLCWYISKPTDIRLEIIINNERSIKPVLEKQLSRPEKGGIYCLNLSSFVISLDPDTEYQWFVAVVPDPEQRSNDIISGGLVTFVELPQNIAKDLSMAAGIGVTAIYAEQGFWYDAISSITELINRNPDDTTLLDQRFSLLQQVGLSKIVDGAR